MLNVTSGVGGRRRRRAAAAFPDSMFSTIFRGVPGIFHSQTLNVFESQYVELTFYGAGFFGLYVRCIIHGVVLKTIDRVQLTILKFNPAYDLVLQLPKII